MRACAAHAAAIVLAVTAAGCDDDDEIIPVPTGETGILEQRWTIEGTVDPGRCTVYGADRMRLVLFDSRGVLRATEFAPCSAFRTALVLPIETYTGNATFVDVSGVAVSETLPIEPFTIFDDRTVSQLVDFPTAAMTL